MAIYSIDIVSKTWRDKVNGNSYSCGWLVLNWGHVDEQTLPITFQYGGQSLIEEDAFRLLKETQNLSKHPIRAWHRHGCVILDDESVIPFRKIWLGRTTKKECKDFIEHAFTSYSFSAD